jgi:hypothetical protein
MADSNLQKPGRIKMPLPLVAPVMVRGNGFRCLAYKNNEGTWISYFSQEPLSGNIEIVDYTEA